MHKCSNRVSGALQALAPHSAKDIAELFGFPHHQFFELAPARMHLLGLALATIPPDEIDLNLLTSPKWADAVRIISDPAPTGIEGVLSSMPLPMWRDDRSCDLWQALHCPRAKLMLQHAKDIAPSLIAILVRLPPTLRTARVTNHLRHPAEAEVLARVLDTEEKVDRLLRSLGTKETRESFFDKVIQTVHRARVFPPLPKVDHEWIEPIQDQHELLRAAFEFKNCLRVYVDEIVAGTVGFYVWRGAEPAVISIRPRMCGLVVDEIKGVANEPVSTETEARIRQVLAKHCTAKPEVELWNERVEECLSALRLAEVDGDRGIEGACRGLLLEGTKLGR